VGAGVDAVKTWGALGAFYRGRGREVGNSGGARRSAVVGLDDL
jgi:hypothetical protein